ncbi:adenosylcobinamide-GDP ribazoletransferase [Chromobacterium phragmitis]|uniref:Adenosylcobinamide-GDP ribazoletransferase n=1 Tax=Chromobacterium phragmitis TaxID=2202141 RepID=A0A344UID1_9NEIS|nr:adenosylcobinamide-GDP ribazoletransferase [Chromobacterium phragmitis]AXE29639.1 adenosylcobinamide-GDP ribazoletransferase [Chromobacterium phragmitis]AXE35029.1 adenosylcobinamide-GDP ribazoletransferase [Chromobacterium phragmitis]
MRGLILAVQFLTRLPTPQLAAFKPEWQAASARWFPAVGLIVGALLLASLRLGGQVDPWLAALLALLAWVMVTGGLHLDGLADLSDALGAAHRSRERFFEVLKDPHLGSFGVLSLILAIVAKLVLLMLIARQGGPAWGLLLVPAWARGFAVAWSATLPAIAPGSGERFAWQKDWAGMGLNLAALLALSAWLAPALLLAPLAGLVWRAFLKRRLGGMTGDCLGAGVELCEIGMLGLLLWRVPGWL